MRFGRVAPSFLVTDLDLAISFWAELGFEVTFTNGKPVCFAIVKRDEAELHLKLSATGAGGSHCHILVEGLDELAAGYTGVVKQPPITQSWGMKDMVVVDPDGNTVEFAEKIGAPA